jgi:probable F420-dependent oxidoreductase
VRIAAGIMKGPDEMKMQLGFTIKPDISVERIVGLTQRAEAAGFEYGWMFDSHILWKEPFPLLALMASNSKSLRLGTCVTNPGARDVTVTASLFATLDLVSGGRMEMGIGRGDSSRRVMGKRPTTFAQLGQFVETFRDLTAARDVMHQGHPMRIAWAGRTPRVWIAGYGPQALRLAGRIADGVILQFADTALISWCLGFVREGAREAGREFAKLEIMAAAAAWISDDLGEARDRVRWFPALVSNHVVDMIAKYGADNLPPSLTAYVSDRSSYDYLHHCELDSSNRDFVSDEVVDRFCIVGPATAHRDKLAELASLGVTQFNLYLMNGDEEYELNQYAREILPRL